MARKTRKRISYVLPLANDSAGHRLGVNGLAVDAANSILYSGGRDGVIYAWNYINRAQSPAETPKQGQQHISWKHVQAHTHWINDLTLVQSNSAIVSASSDISVKIWRPYANDSAAPQTIGLHSDYVKCLASPGPHAQWVASGGLDHKVILWDLNGGGERLEIDTTEEGATTKGSVYAIGGNETLLASGGPENVVKVWDPRSGKRITKFVGHTDNIRSVLVSESSDLVMSASSDQTIKLWSMTGGRCLNTLTMHSDSVWCLYSEHPQLSVFYSSDRSGMVAKTDARNAAEVEDGVCVAICKENEGVNKVACGADRVWTATSSSSINQWADVETAIGVQLPDNMKSYRWSNSSRARMSVSSQTSAHVTHGNTGRNRIPLSCVLRIAHTSIFPPLQPKELERAGAAPLGHSRKSSTVVIEAESTGFAPLRTRPEETIEGQHGLIKHVILNDRRHVLTLDTAGDVTLWDILECKSIRSFGKRHLDEVAKENSTTETLPHWCSVDTRTGTLTCVLEDGHCFDAEMYADELENLAGIEFREDQRINLGKWVLHNLFADLIHEEVMKDEQFRRDLAAGRASSEDRPLARIEVPKREGTSWQEFSDQATLPTPRGSHHYNRSLITPTSAIGAASPTLHPTSPGVPTIAEHTSSLEDSHSRNGAANDNGERSDYFSGSNDSQGDGDVHNETAGRTSAAPAVEVKEEDATQSTNDTEKNGNVKEGTTSFSKRLRMSFGTKKLGRSQATDTNKTATADTKDDTLDPRQPETEDKGIDDCLLAVIQRARNEYRKSIPEEDGLVKSLLNPAAPSEAPLLKPHPTTKIIIQEERPESGGVADLFEGKIGNMGGQSDLIERVAPLWLGELLLFNRVPSKEVIKISFILEPYKKQLPFVTDSDGTERLNANRMLRARKVLAYIGERLNVEPAPSEEGQGESSKRPEEWLQLYCQNQLLSPKMTLATIRHHIWRGGGDVVLVYKVNPDVKVRAVPPPTPGASVDKSTRTGEGP